LIIFDFDFKNANMASLRNRLLNGITSFMPRRAAPTKTVGGMGTTVIGGFVDSGETDNKLMGSQKYRTYNKNLREVAIVASAVRTFLNMVSKAKWALEPAVEDGKDEASDEAKEKADQVTKMMADMTHPWHRIVRRQAMFKFNGFAIQEWTAKRLDDGTIAMAAVEVRPAVTIERWDIDIHGHLEGVMQRIPANGDEVYLPRNKIIYAVDDTTTDSPEGEGLFRHITEAVGRLKVYQDLEKIGFQTDLRGIPIATVPYSELQAEAEIFATEQLPMKQAVDPTVTKESLVKAYMDAKLANIRNFMNEHVRNKSSAALLDSTPYFAKGESGTVSVAKKWDLKLLNGESTAQEAVAKAIMRIIREIAIVLGVDHLLTGFDGSGSLALSQDKTANFLLNVNSTLLDLAEVFTADWLDPIWRLNGWDEALKPTMKPEDISNRSLMDVAAMLRDISAAGVDVRPHDELVTELFIMLGLTPPERDEEDWNDPALGLPGEIDPLTGKPLPPEEVEEEEDPKPEDKKTKEPKKKEKGK